MAGTLLKWPGFMKLVGAVAMMSFYAEVFAFLVESVTLMVYVYFWDNFKNRGIEVWIIFKRTDCEVTNYTFDNFKGTTVERLKIDGT